MLQRYELIFLFCFFNNDLFCDRLNHTNISDAINMERSSTQRSNAKIICILQKLVEQMMLVLHNPYRGDHRRQVRSTIPLLSLKTRVFVFHFWCHICFTSLTLACDGYELIISMRFRFLFYNKVFGMKHLCMSIQKLLLIKNIVEIFKGVTSLFGCI